MHKIYTLATVLWLGLGTAYASNPIDSIGVENYKGNKLIIHKVDPKDTYYSIARKYKVNYKDVMSFNDSKTLNIGITVKVPTAVPFANTHQTTVANNNMSAQTSGIFEYTVQKKDNLNAIAERFKTTVDDIKKLNNLRTINLQIGQVLKINGNQGDNSQSTAVAQPTTTPTTQPTTTPAAVANANGYTIYTVKKKDYIGLIAKNHNTTVDAIKELNGLRSINLQIGQELKIPSAEGTTTTASEQTIVQVPEKTEREIKKEQEAREKAIKADQKEIAKDAKQNGIEHTVVSGETIYTIAKKYNVTTYQITSANKLENSSVKLGQKLVIPAMAKPVETFEPAAQNDSEETENSDSTLKTNALKLPANRYGLSQAEEKGTAVWIADADLDSSKMLVLHRSAIIGTIVKVTNPMTGRSTFAKVVGKFTENETTKDVIIVMTKAVADAVGALDKRFFCQITYSPQENAQ